MPFGSRVVELMTLKQIIWMRVWRMLPPVFLADVCSPFVVFLHS